MRKIDMLWILKNSWYGICKDCHHWKDDNHCDCYANPMVQHSRIGGCAMIPKTMQKEDTKRLNPLKASKRSVLHKRG